MKYFSSICAVLSLVVLTAVSATFAAETVLNSKITSVTVYPTQAQVTRTATLELGAGDHALVFENIPLSAQSASFRSSASGPEGITLLGVERQQKYYAEATDKKVADIERRIARLRNEVKRAIDDRLEVFALQKKFLLSISKTATTKMSEQMERGGLEIVQWRSAYAFVSDGLRSINDSLRIVSLELAKVNTELTVLSQEQHQLRTSSANSSLNLQVNLNLQSAGKVTVELQYVIAGATWTPLYDARMDENSGKVELNYLADITQRTGEDWSDISLTLSTSRPSTGTGPGELARWKLMPYGSRGFLRGGRASDYDLSDVMIDSTSQIQIEVFAESLSGTYTSNKAKQTYNRNVAKPLNVTITEGTYSTTFKIKRKESVPSGEKSVRATIGSWPLESKVELICRPKNREGVFRLVTLTNQESAPLLSGDVSIFAGSDYLGKARIANLVTPSQEFELPFGLENSITVKREIVDYKLDRNTTRVRIDQTIKITLTNNGSESVELTLEEPLPVSQDKQIKVKVKKIEPLPIQSEDKSKVVWNIALAAGEEKVVLVPIRIEHPVTMGVYGI